MMNSDDETKRFEIYLKNISGIKSESDWIIKRARYSQDKRELSHVDLKKDPIFSKLMALHEYYNPVNIGTEIYHDILHSIMKFGERTLKQEEYIAWEDFFQKYHSLPYLTAKLAQVQTWKELDKVWDN